jgi:large subunit ribosomal protein L35
MKGNISMPKFKPHSGMKKRVKITGRGKILREPAGKRHLLEVKTSRRTRRLSGNVELGHSETRKVNKLLGR